MENFSNQVKDLIYYLDDDKGRKLFKSIKGQDKELILQDKTLINFYILLQFLIIPSLSINEIVELFKNNLGIGLKNDELDIAERVRKKLILVDLSDRDNLKNEFKSALIVNKEKIIREIPISAEKKLATVGDWVKDFIANIYSKDKTVLSQAEYFYKQNYYLSLPENEKLIIKKLFSLYKYLSTSSFLPDGFEDDILMRTEDGKLITTKRGQVVVLYDPAKAAKEKKLPENNTKNTITNPTDLQTLAAQYPAGSLERKAIEDEIRRGIRNNE